MISSTLRLYQRLQVLIDRYLQNAEVLIGLNPKDEMVEETKDSIPLSSSEVSLIEDLIIDMYN